MIRSARKTRTTTGATLALLLTLALGGCSASNEGAFSQSAGSGQQAAPDEVAIGRQDSATTIDRQIVQTGSLTVTVASPLDAADAATTIVERADGRVESRTEQAETPAQTASAFLVVRIPSDRLNETLDAIEKLGTPGTVSISAQDVTDSARDLDARITALQTSVDRLLALLSQATTTSDLVTIESTLSERQAELDALTAQRAALVEQVAMATLSIDLVSEGTVETRAPDDFWGAVGVGWHALLSAASGFVIVLGIALPWLAILTILALAILIVVRVSIRAARRRKARSAPASAPAPRQANDPSPGGAPGP